MKATFLSRFTPSLMTPEALESLFVQREDLARRVSERIRDSALTLSKHHTLLIGPRGIGKTHLISLIYHRIRAVDDLRDRLLIAWLREEEWGVTSFLDLLLRIFRALVGEYGEVLPVERIESLYKLQPAAAERAGATLLKEFVGNRTLLVLVENLDDLFKGLGDKGQKRLRAYLQENPFCTIVATAQSLFNGVSLQTSPFYGFFRIHHLEELTFEDATRLLANIANFGGDPGLASFILTPVGRARIRAVHHLAGGNHRVYVIFSQFLTRESLDEFVDPFMRTLDDLTPYYQARMAWLSSQQRKIVEFLCDRRHAVPVKEIAQRCFLTHQVASSQLKTLRDMGYVHAESVGRESYYELREPLMRLCIEVKKNRGEPIRLFVDFLRLWYSRSELQQRLEGLQPSAALEREYVFHALGAAEEDTEDPHVAACLKDYDTYFEAGDFTRALEVAEELVAIRGYAKDWFKRGHCLGRLGYPEKALTFFDRAIELDPEDARAWGNRGTALAKLERWDEALASYDRSVELDPSSAPAWSSRGGALAKLKRLDEALVSLEKAIELDPNVEGAWGNLGSVLLNLGRLDDALAAFDKVIELDPTNVSAWRDRGAALLNLGRLDEAVVSYDNVLKLAPKDAQAWHNRGWIMVQVGCWDEALVAFNKEIGLNPNDSVAWSNRGAALGNCGRLDEALVSCNKAIELDVNNASAWYIRGLALNSLGRYEEALTSLDKAIEFNWRPPIAFFQRAEVLLALGCWEEGMAVLDDALLHFAHAGTLNVGNTEMIVLNLLTNSHDVPVWRACITRLIELYDKHHVLAALGQGLVQSISTLISSTVSDATVQMWRDVWQELASNRKEFELLLRLLDAAVRYRETHDQRILLELPVEERKLLESLLEQPQTDSSAMSRRGRTAVRPY